MQIYIIITAVLIFFISVWMFKKSIVGMLLKLKGKLHIQSLRQAINNADKDKSATGRKNMVVYNISSGEFEPVQKKLLKTASRVTKNKNNAAQTKGRIKFAKPTKKRYINPAKVKQTEQKSLYVTK